MHQTTGNYKRRAFCLSPKCESGVASVATPDRSLSAVSAVRGVIRCKGRVIAARAQEVGWGDPDACRVVQG